MPDRGRYHHGHLRRAVIDTAVEIIAHDGIGAISLRDLARRAGVSHAAPTHHFKDKAGLLTAIAIEGFEMLSDSLEEALDARLPLLELGARYVRFATDHPGYFEVMYRPDVYHHDDPELLAARSWASRLLRAGVAASTSSYRENDDVGSGALAAWSLAHGFSTLARSGNLDEYLEQFSPTELFRRVALRTPSLSRATSGEEDIA